jgi:hypothetical protein
MKLKGLKRRLRVAKVQRLGLCEMKFVRREKEDGVGEIKE